MLFVNFQKQSVVQENNLPITQDVRFWVLLVSVVTLVVMVLQRYPIV